MPNVVDPYLDPVSGILRNKLGLVDQAALDAAEADLTEARWTQLQERPVPVTGDLRQLQAIHHALFQDVYEWRGELRTVDIRKGHGAGAGEFFMPVSRLESGANFAAQELAEDKMLRGLPRDQFVLRLAHHYDQVNYLHPFREGNGRTQRIFWSQVAGAAGYELDWGKVTAAQNVEASRSAMEDRDFTKLRAMISAIVVKPADREPEIPESVRLAQRDFPTSPRAAVSRSAIVDPRRGASTPAPGAERRSNDFER